MARSEIAAGRAFVTLYAKSEGFAKSIADARRRLLEFAEGVQSLGEIFRATAEQSKKFAATVLSSVRVASGALIGGGLSLGGSLAAAATHFANFGSELDDISQRTGIAVQALSELAYAARLSGTNVDDLESAIKNMQKSTAGKGLLGFTGDPVTQLERIADEISGLSDPAARTAKAVEIFGKSGTKLLPMLAGGAAGIRSLRQEAQRFGSSITAEQIRNAAELGDAWDRLKTAVFSVGFQVGSSLSVALTRALNATAEIVGTAAAWVRENQAVGRTLAVIAGGLVTAGVGMAALVAGAKTFSVLAGSFLTTMKFVGLALTAGRILVAIGPGIASVVGGLWSAVTAAGGLAAALSVVGTAAGAILPPLLTAAGITAAVFAAAVAAVAGLAVGTAAAAYSFWKLADPFKALSPLAKSVLDSVRKITGLLLGGDFEGAANAAISGFREAMLQASRAIFEMVRTTLERFPSFIAKAMSGAGGFIDATLRIVRKTVVDMVPAMLASLRLFYEMAKDLFLQLPRMAGYAAGMVVREFAIAFTKLSRWLVEQLVATLSGISSSLIGFGPKLFEAMMGRGTIGMDVFGPLLRNALVGQAMALSAFSSGLMAAPAEFKVSSGTIAAYQALLKELNRGATPGIPGVPGASQTQQARSLSGSFVTYSATALAASGRGGAVDRMARLAERSAVAAEKLLDKVEAHRKETKRMADGLRHG